MKSFLFTTDNDRGGVILCNLDTLEEAVDYLHIRFKGVVRVEQGKDYWTEQSGFVYLNPPQDDPPPEQG
ncbi:hypothetical protein [Neptunomonas sp. XY-337]|uniref:hypothetical protein n=1 Tax=Neptunomonas sp. XY-337 TaxID=2561897 RepID=UPI0010AA46EE|nr:hypothetical protein [Neptunomonas sp. XY-337]